MYSVCGDDDVRVRGMLVSSCEGERDEKIKTNSGGTRST